MYDATSETTWQGAADGSAPANTVAGAPLGPRHFTALDGAMLATFALLVSGHIISAIERLGWVSAAATVGLTALALLGLGLRRSWSPLLLRLLAFGLVAGVCELFTDFAG